MLVEGSIDEAVDEDALRSLEAVRHTSVMISLYAEDGRLLVRNPAAHAALADDEHNLVEHFASAQAAQELLLALKTRGSCSAEFAGVRRFTPIFAPFRKVPSALARVSRS